MGMDPTASLVYGIAIPGSVYNAAAEGEDGDLDFDDWLLANFTDVEDMPWPVDETGRQRDLNPEERIERDAWYDRRRAALKELGDWQVEYSGSDGYTAVVILSPGCFKSIDWAAVEVDPIAMAVHAQETQHALETRGREIALKLQEQCGHEYDEWDEWKNWEPTKIAWYLVSRYW